MNIADFAMPALLENFEEGKTGSNIVGCRRIPRGASELLLRIRALGNNSLAVLVL